MLRSSPVPRDQRCPDQKRLTPRDSVVAILAALHPLVSIWDTRPHWLRSSPVPGTSAAQREALQVAHLGVVAILAGPEGPALLANVIDRLDDILEVAILAGSEGPALPLRKPPRWSASARCDPRWILKDQRCPSLSERSTILSDDRSSNTTGADC